MAKLDELDDEMDKVKEVCIKVKKLRDRAEQASGRLNDIIVAQRVRGVPPPASRHRPIAGR